MGKNKIIDNKVKRHSFMTVLLHWLLALTVFGSFLTIDLKRSIGLTPHIIGGSIMGVVWVVHLIYYYKIRGGSAIFPRRGDLKASVQLIKASFTGAKEPTNDKYLPEQRVAYLYILICVFLVALTGIFRAFAGAERHYALSFARIMGLLHAPAVGLLMIGVVVHLAALFLKANRPLLISMFNGKVDLDYVRKRHEIWYAKLRGKE